MAKVHEVNTILQRSAMQQPYPAFVADSNVGCKILILNKNWCFESPSGCIIPLRSALFRTNSVQKFFLAKLAHL